MLVCLAKTGRGFDPMRVTGTKISFWRCPIRGLAIQYKKRPRTSYSYDSGESYMVLHFCDMADNAEAKRVLVLDMLVNGIELHRDWPNTFFDQQVATIKWLLQAPPSIPAEEWLKARGTVDPRTQPLLRTHEADLRFHLLGEKYGGPTGPVAISIRPRLEALESGI
jgi:hypothetical protein